IRANPIHSSTVKTNALYREKIKGTVWENYQLVVTQWPTQPLPENQPGKPFPGPGDPVPLTSIANTTMETYMQDPVGKSCMACHDRARRGGTDFVWFLRLRAFGPGEGKKEAVDTLKRMLDR